MKELQQDFLMVLLTGSYILQCLPKGSVSYQCLPYERIFTICLPIVKLSASRVVKNNTSQKRWTLRKKGGCRVGHFTPYNELLE